MFSHCRAFCGSLRTHRHGIVQSIFWRKAPRQNNLHRKFHKNLSPLIFLKPKWFGSGLVRIPESVADQSSPEKGLSPLDPSSVQAVPHQVTTRRIGPWIWKRAMPAELLKSQPLSCKCCLLSVIHFCLTFSTVPTNSHFFLRIHNNQ